MERDHDRSRRDDGFPAQQRGAASPGIAFDGAGTPVIAGTAVEAHRIAALLDGDMELDEVLRDYVSLTRDQILAAKAYADGHPWTGRPYPGITAKKAMRALNSDVLRRYLPRRSR